LHLIIINQSSDLDDYEKVREYNNIVRMFNYTFLYLIYEYGYYEYTGNLFIKKYSDYYLENQPNIIITL